MEGARTISAARVNVVQEPLLLHPAPWALHSARCWLYNIPQWFPNSGSFQEYGTFLNFHCLGVKWELPKMERISRDRFVLLCNVSGSSWWAQQNLMYLFIIIRDFELNLRKTNKQISLNFVFPLDSFQNCREQAQQALNYAASLCCIWQSAEHLKDHKFKGEFKCYITFISTLPSLAEHGVKQGE